MNMKVRPETFHCQRCGTCCRVPGYVALTHDEVEKIAAFLGLDVYTFTARYTTLTYNRCDLTLIERADGGCIFLEPDNSCRIQSVKPQQCIGFPFAWKSKQLLEKCPACRELRAGE